MKSLLSILLSFTFFSSFLSAQEKDSAKPVLIVRNHLLTIEPEWRLQVFKTYSSGQAAEVHYLAEDETDEFVLVKKVFHFESGLKKEEVDFSVDGEAKGLVHGLVVAWHPNGVQKEVTYYKMGKKHGPKITYFDDNVVQFSENFEEGLQVGIQTEYFQDSTKKSECFFKNGKVDGEHWKYFPDGKRMSLVTFNEGVQEGHCYLWFENGVLAQKMFFKDGKMENDGNNPAYSKYDEFSAPEQIVNFKAGLPHGMHTIYYPSGQERQKTGFHEGQKNGTITYFFENGGVQGEEFYRQGIPHGKHWKKHANGNKEWNFDYDGTGTSLAPLQVYSEDGILIRQFNAVKGVMHGKTQEWYPSGTIKFDGTLNNGKLDGEVLEYLENGLPLIFSHYKDGNLDGKLQRWHENGKLALKGEYINGELDGELSQWFDTGAFHRVENFVKGTLHGPSKEYTKEGVLLYSANYKSGKPSGNLKEFSEKGDLTFEANYKDGLFDGEVNGFYENKKTSYRFTYKEGKKEGPGVEFWENGTKKFQASYVDDKLDGAVEAWYENGSMHFTRFYKNGLSIGEQIIYFPTKDSECKDLVINKVLKYDSLGRLHEEQKVYFENGKLSSLQTYENGELNGQKSIWTPEGDFLQDCTYENGKLEGKFFMMEPTGHEYICHYKKNKKQGHFERYYPAHPRFGKVKAIEGSFLNGFLQGEACEYNATGLKVASSTFEQGLKDGPAYAFNAKGLLISKANFAKDLLDGDFIQYFPNGEIYMITPYLNNLVQGEQVSYFMDGSKASSNFFEKGKLNGLSQSWNNSGALTFEGEYVMGEKQGKFNKYYDNGKPRIIQKYNEDKLLSKKSFDVEGFEELPSGS